MNPDNARFRRLAWLLILMVFAAVLPACEFLDRVVHPHFGCTADPITGEVVCYLDLHPPHDEEPEE